MKKNIKNKKQKILDEKTYQKYIEKKSPKSNLLRNCFFAFVVGGLICTFAQLLKNIYIKNLKISKENTENLIPVTLIFISSLATGLNTYDNLAKYAGAGTLVPITGFANAIVSPAMEFKKEGYVFGVASKMFVIAGPVLVYGISLSVIIGIVFYIMKLYGLKIV